MRKNPLSEEPKYLKVLFSNKRKTVFLAWTVDESYRVVERENFSPFRLRASLGFWPSPERAEMEYLHQEVMCGQWKKPEFKEQSQDKKT